MRHQAGYEPVKKSERRVRWHIRAWVGISLILLAQGVVFADNVALIELPMRTAKEISTQYVKGAFILKFREGFAELGDSDGAGQGTDVKAFVAARSSRLAALNTKHGVKSLIPAVSPSLLRARSAKAGAALSAQSKAPPGAPAISRIYVGSVPETEDIEALCAEYAADTDVEYCEPDYFVESSFVPNDALYNSTATFSNGLNIQWGLKRINPEAAWDTTGGRGVVVAVIDSGVDDTHPDFFHDINGNGRLDAGEPVNIALNAGEDVNGNGLVDGNNNCPTPNGDFNCIDDDGNGFIDDIRGWDFSICDEYSQSGTCVRLKARDNDPSPGMNAHGSLVAGVIAARGNNGIGISGTAPRALIMNLRAINEMGNGTLSDMIAAFIYAVQMGADVINNSWGATITTQSIRDAVTYAQDAGVVVVFASGNDHGAVVGPASMTSPKPIVVAASELRSGNDVWPSFSDYGPTVDVAAPGVLIMSLNPIALGGNYSSGMGTSFAAPFVSGLAALLKAVNPAMTPEQIRQAIRAGSDDMGTAGFDDKSGEGRINVGRTFSQLNLTLWGDFDGNRTVTINELIRAVNFALGTLTPSAAELAKIDANGNGRVDINELILAVKTAMDGAGAADVAASMDYDRNLIVSAAEENRWVHNPHFDPAPASQQYFFAGVPVTVYLRVLDADQDAISLSVVGGGGGLPAGASFTPTSVRPGVWEGSFTWQVPTNGTTLTFIASDGVYAESSSVTFTGCFIATAAYGTPMAPELATLRAFRDQVLLTHPAGQAFVAWYYRTSPPIARFISDKPWLRALVRGLLYPVIEAAKWRLQRK